MKTKQQLQDELRNLHNNMNAENFKQVLPKIKAIETQLREVEKAELLRNVNGKYTRLRELARQAFECEQPTEDITTADGSFHKTKVKKYEKLSLLPYGRATWKDGRITAININGEKFNMLREKYEYNKPTEYTRPSTFGEFLELNNIPAQEITLAEFQELNDNLNKANEELNAAIEKYSSQCKKLNVSSYQYWGLINQDNTHTYKYSTRNN
jgi:chaperonin cofactor prefoldin